jgi:hypothetical protein
VAFLRGIRVLIATLAVATVCAFAGTGHALAATALPYDLNGDGRQELVVGLQQFGGLDSVAVLSGSAERLVDDPRLLTEESLGIPEDERGYGFGDSLASGDFDGDGMADLAAGVLGGGPPRESDGDAANRVVVMYGSASGDYSRAGVVEGPPLADDQTYSNFGAEIVAGDLNRDGFADLVVRHGPGEPYIHVIFGGPDGLADSAGQTFSRPEGPQQTGLDPLALGDANGDGHLDLFEADRGYPFRFYDDGFLEERPRPGSVNEARGTADGPVAAYVFRGEVVGGAFSLALGDVTGDGYPDLVTGTTFDKYYDERRWRDAPTGVVRIWRGGPSGPGGKPILIDEATPGVRGKRLPRGDFGRSVAVGRLDGDRFADIVVGAEGHACCPPGPRRRGRVFVIRGGRKGYAKTGHLTLTPGEGGIPGGRRTRGFGSAVSLLDHDGDGRLDLSVAHSVRIGRTGVIVLRGTQRGLFTPDGAEQFKIARLGLTAGEHAAMCLGRVGSSCAPH